MEDVFQWFEETKASIPKDSYLHSEFTIEEEYECKQVILTIYYKTEQTDEELAVEKKREEDTLILKRKQLEQLKKELGDA